MRRHKALPRSGGINNVEFSLEGMDIVCISDYELELMEQIAIENFLGLDMTLGKRWIKEQRRMPSGKYFTTWSVLESNWS